MFADFGIERALAILEKVLGASNNLARLLQAQGDVVAARPLYKRALTIWEKVFGPEHMSINRGRRNFATLLLASGDASEAFARGARGSQQVTRPDPPVDQGLSSHLGRRAYSARPG